MRADLTAEKAGDLLRLDAQHRLAGEMLVERPLPPNMVPLPINSTIFWQSPEAGIRALTRTRARIDSRTAEPIVRRLFAGGKEIRTAGPT